jgi:hypothetical protein
MKEALSHCYAPAWATCLARTTRIRNSSSCHVRACTSLFDCWNAIPDMSLQILKPSHLCSVLCIRTKTKSSGVMCGKWWEESKPLHNLYRFINCGILHSESRYSLTTTWLAPWWWKTSVSWRSPIWDNANSWSVSRQFPLVTVGSEKRKGPVMRSNIKTHTCLLQCCYWCV